MSSRRVGIFRVAGMERYERLQPPFDPDADYPELQGVPRLDSENFVFRAFRDFLILLEWDRDSYGLPTWNPFGWLIQPGHTVVIKPNLVVSEHPHGDQLVRHTNTDGPVVRCVAEYVLVALKGRGRLIIGDSPIKETDFERATTITGLSTIVATLRARTSVPVELIDFRDFISRRNEVAMVDGRAQRGDPRGYTEFDLGQHSALDEVSRFAGRFRSTAAYYENRMADAHNQIHHRYSVANSALRADVFINVPKLKTHCKAGITVALKNLVGICNEKRWLPHHRRGPPKRGGDEYSDRAQFGLRLIEFLKDLVVQNGAGRIVYPKIVLANRLWKRALGVDLVRRIRDHGDPYQNGGWHGNDTVWRMVLDLNKVLLYGQPDGSLGERVSRRMLTFVDGLWAGEAEGPLKPSAKTGGILMAGTDSVLIDVAAATLMGFDFRKIRMVARALASTDLPLTRSAPDTIDLVSNVDEWRTLDGIAAHHLAFVPPRGWAGHIEIDAPLRGSDVGVGSASRGHP